MLKEVIKRSALGAAFGIVISQLLAIIISLCIADGNFYAVVPSLVRTTSSQISAVMIQTACSLLYGAIFGGASVIWELDHWSILKQTVVHFLIVSIATLFVAYVCQWMGHSALGVIIYFTIFAAIYACIWFGQYMAIKKRIDSMNEKVKKTT